jgi:hypothetical protein
MAQTLGRSARPNFVGADEDAGPNPSQATRSPKLDCCDERESLGLGKSAASAYSGGMDPVGPGSDEELGCVGLVRLGLGVGRLVELDGGATGVEGDEVGVDGLVGGVEDRVGGELGLDVGPRDGLGCVPPPGAEVVGLGVGVGGRFSGGFTPDPDAGRMRK